MMNGANYLYKKIKKKEKVKKKCRKKKIQSKITQIKRNVVEKLFKFVKLGKIRLKFTNINSNPWLK